ncbi:MAG: trigger factor [Roseburia sp.]|nr:trigger factor [Roseburia sp.]
MKKRAFIISTFLSVSLMLTGCSWDEIRAKFTGEDLSVSGSAVVVEDYDATECVTLPEYKGIEVDCTVSDDEIQSEINAFLSQNATEKKIKKGTCKEGDAVNIDFVGKIDGKEFDNGSAQDQTITLGSSGYIDGFDDGIIGMKVGEEKDINVTFPEDYGKDELNGKPAVFTITLNYISETIEAELTDELVAEKTEQKTVAEYKEATKERLVKEKKDSVGETAYGQLNDETEVKKYPESLLTIAKGQLDIYYKGMATQYGYSDFNSFLSAMQMDEASYNESLQKAAESIAKTQLIAEAVAAKENITVTDEEVKNEIASMSEQAGQTEEQFRTSFEEYYGGLLTIERYYQTTLLTNKVVDFVGENAAIKE